jgi:hypothetical protein
VHEITPRGLERLTSLLAEPGASTPPRNGLLLRLFFGPHLPPGAVRDLLTDAQSRASSAVEQYEQVRATLDPGEPGQVYRTMTLSFGEHMARAQQAWADESLAALEEAERAGG